MFYLNIDIYHQCQESLWWKELEKIQLRHDN